MKAKLIKTDSNNFVLETNNGFLSGTLEPSSFEYKLSLKNCQAIERGYDLDELAEIKHPISMLFDHHSKHRDKYDCNLEKRNAFIEGAKTILEILSDKKFSEEDVMLGWDAGVMSQSICFTNYFGLKRGSELKSHRKSYQRDLKPSSLQQTEWEVEVEMEYIGRIKMNKLHEMKPKRDADGCIVLKRKQINNNLN